MHIGKTAERRVAAALSRIIGLRFERTPGSGSANRWLVFKKYAIRGDIICMDDTKFPFLIESKKSKDFKLDLLFEKPISADFVKWWHKTCTDAKLENKCPMLVISRFQGPMLTFARERDWMRVGLKANQAIGRFFYGGTMLVVTTVEEFAHGFKELLNKPGEFQS